MFFKKNLPVWERVLRTVGGLAMSVWGYSHFSGSPLGFVFAASGAITVLTGFIGFCPMCALVGRKLKSQ